jgi:hypothetical protein
MYKKGQWVLHAQRRLPMRVQRDQAERGPDMHRVWCEWLEGGYHLQAHDAGDITPLPREEWPEDL